MSVANDLSLYERHATAWWDESSPVFRSLRTVGAFHLQRIAAAWGERLPGAQVVDLGCGGGFVALGLAAQGARVTGIDRSPASLHAAREEAGRRRVPAQFLEADLRSTPLPEASADFVVLNDVLEHLEDPQAALAEAARLLRPEGELFLNSFDRSWRSRFAVVTLAEGLGLVPRGTHDARLFVRPNELQTMAARCGLWLRQLDREGPALWPTLRSWTIHLRPARRGVAYSAFLQRAGR